MALERSSKGAENSRSRSTHGDVMMYSQRVQLVKFTDLKYECASR